MRQDYRHYKENGQNYRITRCPKVVMRQFVVIAYKLRLLSDILQIMPPSEALYDNCGLMAPIEGVI